MVCSKSGPVILAKPLLCQLYSLNGHKDKFAGIVRGQASLKIIIYSAHDLLSLITRGKQHLKLVAAA